MTDKLATEMPRNNDIHEAREDLHDLHFKYLCEIADLRRELDETRAAFNELRAVVLARQPAQDELVASHREREIVRAQAAERDPALPLQ